MSLIKSSITNLISHQSATMKEYQKANYYISKGFYEFRPHSEIVFSNTNFSQKKFDDLIKKTFTDYVKYILFIKEELKALKNKEQGKSFNLTFAEILQDWGDNIRATGNPFVFHEQELEPTLGGNLFILPKAIRVLIKALKFRIKYLDPEYNFGDQSSKNQNALIVIECFRNPYEIEYFRAKESEFYVFSISADKDIRQQRVNKIGYFDEGRNKRLQGRKNLTSEVYKLAVETCVQLSDIAISNNSQDYQEKTFQKILEYLALIKNPGCIPPTHHELYMHIAYSNSLKSTCISRQVGAVITGPKGFIVGAGWNAPGFGQVGCAFRSRTDLLNIDNIPLTTENVDKTQFKKILKKMQGEYVCYKDIMSQIEREKKYPYCSSCQKEKADTNDIKRLEYCRALHAEENAILQSAKIGGMPIEHGVLYTTTYPCELCAKKLYQIGIRKVYYTEAYPESISKEVFLKDGTKTIEMIAFEGVKSNSYFRIFKAFYNKKDLLKIKLD
ncbi:MAG: hypothetical protein GY710_14915 [Desulfobacteraceae bacterium]|nr:hypothetical protein [Desulfobacteraceae bacterium]